MHVVRLEEGGSDWRIVGRDGTELRADKVVIACGPWAPDLCEAIGYRVPMAWERGYHAQLESPQPGLQRPVFDAQKGFVMAPQGRLTRISSGVEFAHRDAVPNYRQIERAVVAARESAEFGAQVDGDPWMGSRPTLPDGLPVIGRADRHRNLWFNFGHQHIGMSTSTGSAVVIADLLTGRPGSEQEAAACAPARFGL
jgi:D-amino-acid dehydrogenase